MTDPRDDDLVALYRQLPRAEPPAALDAAVLAGARAAVRPRRPAWLAPVAAAAAMVLAIGVGWQLRHEPLRETTPAAAPATAPTAGAAAEAQTMAAPAAEPAREEAKAEHAVANEAEAMPAPQAAAPAPPAADAAVDAATAGAAAEAEPRPAPPATAARRDARADAEDERLQEVVVTGSRVAAPRQRTVVTPPATESIAAPAPPVADMAAQPPVAPAPPAPPAPAEPPGAQAHKTLSAERAAGALTWSDADAIATAFDEIRALRDAGRRDEAVAALARLLDAHPTLEIPEDLRDLRD
jgi:hypothetical protein